MSYSTYLFVLLRFLRIWYKDFADPSGLNPLHPNKGLDERKKSESVISFWDLNLWSFIINSVSFLMQVPFTNISTILGYLMPKPSFKRAAVILFNPYTFPKGISLKVNVIARLMFEPAYYDVAVQHISHYAVRTPSTFLSAEVYQ